MLWSIVKIVAFFAIIAAAAFGANHLLAVGGGVRIVMAGQEFSLTPLMAVVALLALMLLMWVLLKLLGMLGALLRFINGDETAFSRHFSRRRERKGYNELSEGVLALASGDGASAMSHAQKANKYLNRPALTNLITAQAAELAGQDAKAEAAYKELVKTRKTQFVGVQGVMRQKLKAGDKETAAALAQKALELKPSNVEVQDTLLKLQAEKQDWKGARQTLNTKLKQGALPRDVHRRRDAVLALSEARDLASEDGKAVESREAAIEANRLSPDLVPAAVMAARSQLEQGSKRAAAKTIVKAWKTQPHPELAAVFAEIEPDESPKLRHRRFQKLVRAHSDHPECRLLDAELCIAGEDFPAARRALSPVLDNDPDARALTMMAAVERGEGASDTIVKSWLARAVTAPRGPQWVCDKCHKASPAWSPTCAHCQSFDTLTWTTPPATEATNASGLGMLPLIVGEALSGPSGKPDEAPTSSSQPPADEIPDAELVDDEAKSAEDANEDQNSSDADKK